VEPERNPRPSGLCHVTINSRTVGKSSSSGSRLHRRPFAGQHRVNGVCPSNRGGAASTSPDSDFCPAAINPRLLPRSVSSIAPWIADSKGQSHSRPSAQRSITGLMHMKSGLPAIPKNFNLSAGWTLPNFVANTNPDLGDRGWLAHQLFIREGTVHISRICDTEF